MKKRPLKEEEDAPDTGGDPDFSEVEEELFVSLLGPQGPQKRTRTEEEDTMMAQVVRAALADRKLSKGQRAAIPRLFEDESFFGLLQGMNNADTRKKETPPKLSQGELFELLPVHVRKNVWEQLLFGSGLLTTSWILRGSGRRRGLPDMEGINIQNDCGVLSAYASSLCAGTGNRLQSFINMLRRVNPFSLLQEEMQYGSLWHRAVLKTVIAAIHWFEIEHIRYQTWLDSDTMEFLITNNYMHFMRRHLPDSPPPGRADYSEEKDYVAAKIKYEEDIANVPLLYDEASEGGQGPGLYSQARGSRMYWLEVRFSNFTDHRRENYAGDVRNYYPTTMEIIPADNLARDGDETRVIRYIIQPAGTDILNGGTEIPAVIMTPADPAQGPTKSFIWPRYWLPTMPRKSPPEERAIRRMYRRFCGAPTAYVIPESGMPLVESIPRPPTPFLSSISTSPHVSIVRLLLAENRHGVETFMDNFDLANPDNQLRLPYELMRNLFSPPPIAASEVIKNLIFFKVLWRHEVDWVPMVRGLTTITETPHSPAWRNSAPEFSKLSQREKWTRQIDRVSLPFQLKPDLAAILRGNASKVSRADIIVMLSTIKEACLSNAMPDPDILAEIGFIQRFEGIFAMQNNEILVPMARLGFVGRKMEHKEQQLGPEWAMKYISYLNDLLMMYESRVDTSDPMDTDPTTQRLEEIQQLIQDKKQKIFDLRNKIDSTVIDVNAFTPEITNKQLTREKQDEAAKYVAHLKQMQKDQKAALESLKIEITTLENEHTTLGKQEPGSAIAPRSSGPSTHAVKSRERAQALIMQKCVTCKRALATHVCTTCTKQVCTNPMCHPRK